LIALQNHRNHGSKNPIIQKRFFLNINNSTTKRKFKSNMDYEGQRLAELIFYWIILSLGAVGWVIGYFKQDFMIVFQLWLVGVVISVVVRTKIILLKAQALQTVILIDCNYFRVV
jgi:hypothetical protein